MRRALHGLGARLQPARPMDRLKAEESAADHRARAAGVCRAPQVASATLLHTLHAGLRMHSASDDTRT